LDPLPEGNLANFPFAAISIRILFYNAMLPIKSLASFLIFSYLIPNFPPLGKNAPKLSGDNGKRSIVGFS
jgi:hypothetical protein